MVEKPNPAALIVSKVFGIDAAELFRSIPEAVEQMKAFCIHFDSEQKRISQQLAALTLEMKRMADLIDRSKTPDAALIRCIPQEALNQIRVEPYEAKTG